MTEDEQVKALEDTVLELLLATKLILRELFISKTLMTTETHTIIHAQSEREIKAREIFEKYIQRYDIPSKNLKKRFEETEKL